MISPPSQRDDFNDSNDDVENEWHKNLKIYIAIAVSVISLFIILAIVSCILRSRRRKQLDEHGEIGRVYRPAGSGKTLPAYPGGYDGGSYGNANAGVGGVQNEGSELRDTSAPEVKPWEKP